MINKEIPSDDPNDLFEWLWRIKHYESTIFTRVNGETKALSELNAKAWALNVSKWLQENALPVRVRSDEEIAAQKAEKTKEGKNG